MSRPLRGRPRWPLIGLKLASRHQNLVSTDPKLPPQWPLIDGPSPALRPIDVRPSRVFLEGLALHRPFAPSIPPSLHFSCTWGLLTLGSSRSLSLLGTLRSFSLRSYGGGRHRSGALRKPADAMQASPAPSTERERYLASHSSTLEAGVSCHRKRSRYESP